MTLQYYTTSMFKPNNVACKASSPRQLVNISHFKGSKICMRISSSTSLGANTKTTTTNDILGDFMSPILAATNTMGMIQDNNFVKFNQHHELKVIIQPQVDVNNKIDELKESTKRFLTTTSDLTMTMKLIDTIQRLGVGYYFKEEIDQILNSLPHGLPDDDDDLYTTALCFRLQRHNGLHTNPDVFNKFLDANGKVKKSLSEDIDGLLSLYEASYLGTNEEYLLLHEKEFTTRHLQKSLSRLCPKLQKKVVDGLEVPRHMRMERLEARRYIEAYGNEDDHNPILLEFAKMDYNRVQSIFRKELVEVTRWWNQLRLASKLSFVRDRQVECFVWTMGILPEPKYTSCRIVLAKIIAIMLVIDDIYDTYGKYDDLVLFTRAIQRWDLNEVEQLPEYMKVCYMVLYNTNNEICDQVLKEHGLCVQPFLRKTWIDLVEAYMVEVEWLKQGIMPNFKDYIDNGIVTSGTYMAMVHLFVLISEGVTNDENIRHLLDPYPKFFTLAGTILRLWDDLGTSKEEEERGDVLSSIQLLMKDKNIPCEEEGRKQILQTIQGLWNDLNSELIKSDLGLFPMIRVAFNISRASQVVYQHNENSYLSSVKSQVQNLFFEPIDF